MTQLGDFMFVAVDVSSARHVAGFDTARSTDDKEVKRALVRLFRKKGYQLPP